MEAQEIIRKFISNGFQLNSDSLKFFLDNQEKMDSIISKLKILAPRPTTITKQQIQNLLSEIETELRVIQDFPKVGKTFTTSELAETFQNQYNTIKKFLINRIDLPNTISINKISDKLREFSIIARVSEIDGNKIILEDLTKQISASISADAEQDGKLLIEGETSGFICTNGEHGLQVQKIIWPDIQFRKEIARSKTKAVIAFSNTANEQIEEKIPKSSIKIFLGNEGLRFEKENENRKLPDPCIVEIGGVKIFLSHGKMFENYLDRLGDTAAKIILNLVRKRLLFPPSAISENFVLEEVPDIFVVDSFGAAESTTYKGTTFLSLGDPNKTKTAWITDLQTRENIKIDLS